MIVVLIIALDSMVQLSLLLHGARMPFPLSLHFGIVFAVNQSLERDVLTGICEISLSISSCLSYVDVLVAVS